MARAPASETFHFKLLQEGGSRLGRKGINWIDIHIEYREMHTGLCEAVASFAHLCA